MSDLFLTSPFDILFKDFFNTNSPFTPAKEAKYSHPVDIYEDDKGLNIEVACTGLDKDDIDIVIESSVLRIKHNRQDQEGDDEYVNYIHRSISRRSFNLGYRISNRFDLDQANAEFKNGLLIIDIPFAKSAKPKSLKIK